MKKIGVLVVLAIAMLSVSALAEKDWHSEKDVLQMGIFETEESMLKFPAGQDTNIDSLEVGNDRALAQGSMITGLFHRPIKATATNNLEIKKNQDSGECKCCEQIKSDAETIEGRKGGFDSDCRDCCIKVNVDQIKVGNREALAFGFASATNNVKIVAHQQ